VKTADTAPKYQYEKILTRPAHMVTSCDTAHISKSLHPEAGLLENSTRLPQQRLPAIQTDALAVHIGGAIAAQQGHEAADILLAVTHPLHRHTGAELGTFSSIFFHPAFQAGGQRQRQDGIAADIVAAPFASGCASQGADGFFDGGIGAVVTGVPALGSGTAQIDDAAITFQMGIAEFHHAEGGKRAGFPAGSE